MNGHRCFCRGIWSRSTGRTCRRAPCGTRRRNISGGTSDWMTSSSCGGGGASRPTAATTRTCSGRSTRTHRMRRSCSAATDTLTTTLWRCSGCTRRSRRRWAGSNFRSRRKWGISPATGGSGSAPEVAYASGIIRRRACPMCWAATRPEREATASPPMCWTTVPGSRWRNCRCRFQRYSMPGRSIVWGGTTTTRWWRWRSTTPPIRR